MLFAEMCLRFAAQSLSIKIPPCGPKDLKRSTKQKHPEHSMSSAKNKVPQNKVKETLHRNLQHCLTSISQQTNTLLQEI